MRVVAFLVITGLSAIFAYIAYSQALKHVLRLNSKEDCQNAANWTVEHGCAKPNSCCAVWVLGHCFAGDLKESGGKGGAAPSASCTFEELKMPLILLGIAGTLATLGMSVLLYPSSSSSHEQQPIIIVEPSLSSSSSHS